MKRRNFKVKICFTCKKIYKPTTGNTIFCNKCTYKIKCFGCKKYFFGNKKRKYCSIKCGKKYHSWNRGLTKDTNIIVKKNSISIKKTFDKRLEEKIKLFNKGINIFNWQDINKYIKINYKNCQICKKKIKIETHHKDKNRKNNKKTNLYFLCRFCHMHQHPERIEKFRKRSKKQKGKNHPNWRGRKSIYCLLCNKRITIPANHLKKFCSRFCHYSYRIWRNNN